MLGWLRYVVLVFIILIPITIFDDVVSGIEHGGIRFAVRLLVLLLGLNVVRLIPLPQKQP
ncbi:hypothetical protein HYV74_04740 [Candidatus Uhrbacteria bacterium]|nr:hypothetical protein [Candidatus Uhrbacteria bacterium]